MNLKNIIIHKVAAPLSRRVGTAIASFLAGAVAVDPALIERVELVVGAVVMLCIDLFASHINNKAKEVA